ncbi:MAG: cytochrome c biogenesis protein CcsA, partial [Planctomycetales bacterium]|nr:cytochrome c biogenesis protein CcsA [Planctomycetales bacterium]
DGDGMSAVLQHPAMLVHPPIVFFGYALWTVPFALAMAALIVGDFDEANRLARGWALCGWLTLGAGILIGGYWAYNELGWGGYWNWDPVENGSLIPWLLGTAYLHALMAWRRSGVLQKTAMATGLATFGCCNFSAFLTRSGIFSSLHAFSQSPIGWLFLWLMLTIVGATIGLIVWRQRDLRAVRALSTLVCREAMIMLNCSALILLGGVIAIGTLLPTMAAWLSGSQIVVGPEFYNRAVVPVGFAILITTATAPLLRWRQRPTDWQRRGLLISGGVASIVMVAAWIGLRQGWIVSGLFACLCFGFTASVMAIGHDFRQHLGSSLTRWQRLARSRRALYAGLTIHLGLFVFALGLGVSSLGSERSEVTLPIGEAVDLWGRSIRLDSLTETPAAGKRIVAANLVLTDRAGAERSLSPAQHYHWHRREWTTEAAIDATWQDDFYAVLNSSDLNDNVRLTFLRTPGMSLVWLGAWMMGAGGLLAAWPRTGQRGAATLVDQRLLQMQMGSQQRHAA